MSVKKESNTKKEIYNIYIIIILLIANSFFSLVLSFLSCQLLKNLKSIGYFVAKNKFNL